MRCYFRNLAFFFLVAFCANSILSVPISPANHQISDDTLRNSLIQLNWAANEVEDISKILSGQCFLREQASERMFKETAPEAGIIHLATHAIINDESPMFSKLIFANTGDSLEDGSLNTYELYNMNLKANLAVLSACNTGMGKFMQGEGIMSLARGFMYAGCPNVLMSLWTVDDKSTSQIMTHFYEGLSSGLDKDEALRNAKLAYIQQSTDIKKSPFYWAPFILIGDPKPLPSQSPLPLIFGILVLTGVIGGVFLILNQRKSAAFAAKMLISIIYMIGLGLLILFLLPKSGLFSQEKLTEVSSDTTYARNLLDSGIKLFEKAKYDSSILILETASPIFRQAEMWEAYVTTLNHLGNNFQKKAQLQAVTDIANQALKIGKEKLGENHPQIATSYKLIATVHYMKKEFEPALAYYNQALEMMKACQGEKNQIVASLYNNIGAVYHVQKKLDQALANYQKALAIRVEIFGEMHPSVGTVYHNIGYIYRVQGHYDQAIRYYHKALAILLETGSENHPNVANTYNLLGGIYCSKGDFDKGLEYFQKYLTIRQTLLGNEHPGVLQATKNIGLLYYEKGDYEKALAYFAKIMAVPQNEQIQAYLDDLCNDLGLVFSAKGDYDKALRHFENYILTNKNRFNEYHPNIATGYNNMGEVFERMGEYDRALTYYNHAIEINKKSYDRFHPSISTFYKNIASIYTSKGEYDNALDITKELLAIEIQKYGEIHHRVGDCYFSLGSIYSLMGKANLALDNLRKALKIQTAVFGEKHPGVALIYKKMGDVFFQQGELNDALKNYSQSLAAYAAEFQGDVGLENPDVADLMEYPDVLATLTARAKILKRIYNQNPAKIGQLIQSGETYELAIQYLDKLRNSYFTEKSKLFMSGKGHEVYREAVPVMLQLFEQTGDAHYKEKAFQLAEKNKSHVLHQALVESKARHFANIPDSLLEQEKNLKINISFYDKNIFEEKNKGDQADSTKIAFWQEKLFNLKRDYENLILRFENEFPDYFNLKYQNTTVSIATIQQDLLEENDALLEYFIGDSVLYIFVVHKTGFEIDQLKIDSSLSDPIFALRDALTQRSYADYVENAFGLYKKLIQPVAENIGQKDLLIIPDGILGYLPFETLLTHKAGDIQSEDYDNLTYLMQEHQITYNYSATLLAENLSRRDKGSENKYVGFAPVVFK